MKEAYLYKKLEDKKVRCLNCAHYCILHSGQRGLCGAKENINDKLYSLVYGKVIAVHIDPIEKKPLFHFLPGSYSLSVATVDCPLFCKTCQNYDISQGFKDAKEIPGEEISPQKIVDAALENNLPSISYTYTDPIAFSEYALDTMKLARKAGLKNVWVSSGFWSKELFDLISNYLHAANIDLKGFTDEFYIKYCGAKLHPVLDSLKRIKDKGIWLEVTTLVIPTLNDSPEILTKIAQFIKNELGDDTPWHITQFCAAISWKLKNLPDTPMETLKKAWQIGKETGLKYVYTGNIPGLPSEDTYCPKCNALVIDRTGYFVNRYDKQGKCPKCGEKIAGFVET